jgi:cobalamin biosynthesis protein CobD/CbiB
MILLDRRMSEQGKTLIDVGSFAIVGATLIEWLPAAAAALSIVWTIIRLLETDTVKKWMRR